MSPNAATPSDVLTSSLLLWELVTAGMTRWISSANFLEDCCVFQQSFGHFPSRKCCGVFPPVFPVLSHFFFWSVLLESWQFWQLCSKFSLERVSVPQTASVFCISSWSFCPNSWACLTYWCSSCCNEFMKYAYGGLEKPIKTHAFCMDSLTFLLPPVSSLLDDAAYCVGGLDVQSRCGGKRLSQSLVLEDLFAFLSVGIRPDLFQNLNIRTKPPALAMSCTKQLHFAVWGSPVWLRCQRAALQVRFEAEYSAAHLLCCN